MHNNQSKQLTLKRGNGQKMLITLAREMPNQNCYHTDKEWTEYQSMTFTGYTHMSLHFATNNKYHQWYQFESNKTHNVSKMFKRQLRVRGYTSENMTSNYKLLLISTVSLRWVSRLFLDRKLCKTWFFSFVFLFVCCVGWFVYFCGSGWQQGWFEGAGSVAVARGQHLTREMV